MSVVYNRDEKSREGLLLVKAAPTTEGESHLPSQQRVHTLIVHVN